MPDSPQDHAQAGDQAVVASGVFLHTLDAHVAVALSSAGQQLEDGS